MTAVMQVQLQTTQRTSRRPYFRAAQVASWGLITLVLWQTAWLSDDAAITLRSALAWGHGYGPNFNITESVASYTHPLWFLMITAQGMVTGSWVYGMLYLALALASAAVLILLLRTRNVWQLAVCVIPILLGASVIDWLGSGLEGPLAAVLLAGLAYCALDHPRAVAGVLVGLLLLCRLDLVILVGPALLYVAVQLRQQRKELALLVAGLVVPVGAWALWAQMTYGYVLPSTFAAKTNSEIPTAELVGRGLEYIVATLRYDPLLLLGVFLAVLLAVKGSMAVRLWVVGTVLYTGYVVVIGGDYLLGRFQLLPMVALLLALTGTEIPSPRRSLLFWIAPVVALTVAIPTTRVLDFGMQSQPRTTKAYFQDERFWSVKGRALDPLGAITIVPSPYYPVDLVFMDEVADSWPEGQVFSGQVETVCHGLGGYGFIHPPSVHIIDPCGLADRFMASLPFRPTGYWKAGHFERDLPAGYRDAVAANDPTLVADPELRARLKEIWSRIRPPSGQ